jgi:hypothetical protein
MNKREKSNCQGIQISMDGKGREFDNIFVARFWRTIKPAFCRSVAQAKCAEGQASARERRGYALLGEGA